MATTPQISVDTSQDSQTTLQRLADSIRLRTLSTVTLAPEAEPIISRETDQAIFEGLDSVIKGLGPLVKQLKAAAARYEFQDTQVQDAAISRALRPFSAGHQGKSDRFPGGVVADFEDDFVLGAAIHARGMKPGESLDITFEITSQSDAAGAFLDFGANISGSSLLVSTSFEFGGTDGSATISFASGQSLSQIVAAVNAQTGSTGVQAVASSTGLVLRAISSGSGSFVSVRSTEQGTADATQLTIFEVSGSAQSAAITGDGTTFADSSLFEDFGADLEAEINGQSAELIGNYWVANIDSIDIALDVDEDAIIEAGGSADLGTISKPKHGRSHEHGNDSERGHRVHDSDQENRSGESRHKDRVERDDINERDESEEIDEHGGGLRPNPDEFDPESSTKVASNPTLSVDFVA